MSSPPFFTGVRVTRSLVLCVCFVERCLLFTGVRVTRSLVLCVCFVERCLFVFWSLCGLSCPSLIYGF